MPSVAPVVSPVSGPPPNAASSLTRRNVAILVAGTLLAVLLLWMLAVVIDIEGLIGRPLTGLERAGLATLAFLGTALVVIYLAWSGPTAYGATLQGTALWLPWTAALASSALYLANIPEHQFLKDNALLVGSGVAVAVWLLYALVDRGYPTARRQSPGWYGLLKGSIAALRLRAAEAPTACPDASDATIRLEVTKHLDKLANDVDGPGLQWVTRAGFNVAWTDYHRADEALISVIPKASLIDVAISDLLRLDGSDIKGRAALQADLQAALKELDAKIEPYVSGLVPKDPVARADDSTPAGDTAKPVNAAKATPSNGFRARVTQWFQAITRKQTTGSDKNAKPDASDCEAERRSRTVIRTIHRSLNTYRGSRWAELGRARWQLMITTTVAGIVAFLVLALVLIRGVQPEQLVVGWAYFLVGATAGLFLRLRLASEEYQVNDDYGLEAARVYQTPLLSGMAAVIGVVLMASVAGSSLADILTPGGDPAAVPAASTSPETASSASAASSAAPAASPAASGEEVASASEAPGSTQPTNTTLSKAFSLEDYPLGVVIALAFGLTPNLVLRRLGISASNAKKDLLATRPT